MSKVAVSVSMEPEQAARYRDIAQRSGESFSAVVCRFAAAGEFAAQVESRLDELDDEDGTENEIPLPPDNPAHPIEHEPENIPVVPPDLAAGNGAAKRSFPAQSKLKNKTVLEQVFSCLSPQPELVFDIANHLGLSDAEVGAVIEELIEDDRPVILRRVEGEWMCWSPAEEEAQT